MYNMEVVMVLSLKHKSGNHSSGNLGTFIFICFVATGSRKRWQGGSNLLCIQQLGTTGSAQNGSDKIHDGAAWGAAQEGERRRCIALGICCLHFISSIRPGSEPQLQLHCGRPAGSCCCLASHVTVDGLSFDQN